MSSTVLVLMKLVKGTMSGAGTEPVPEEPAVSSGVGKTLLGQNLGILNWIRICFNFDEAVSFCTSAKPDLLEETVLIQPI